MNRSFVSMHVSRPMPIKPVKAFFPSLNVYHTGAIVIEPLPFDMWMMRVTESLCDYTARRISLSVWFEVEA